VSPPRTAQQPDERQLLARAARGDERAAAAIFDAFADPLYGYGLRRLHDHHLAEELVQRVLERLWRRADGYDPARGSVAAYVFAIARSTVLDLRREVARRHSRTARGEHDPPDIDDAAEGVLLTASVKAAVARLSDDHQQVLGLAYAQGLTQREIAARLGIPLGTVKSRTYYALEAFRLACEELGVRP
jgi:RNA polymerase sigma-70 factor (ECF subfamily)